MSHAATCYGPFTRRRRAFFLVRATQQVPSQLWVLRQLARETVRALAALAGAAAWAALLLLLAG